MTYHFYFKNSEPVYETEYMQSLKQFVVQELFPAYVLKVIPKWKETISYLSVMLQRPTRLID